MVWFYAACPVCGKRLAMRRGITPVKTFDKAMPQVVLYRCECRPAMFTWNSLKDEILLIWDETPV
jgi:phage terminase large subunit GpA-like protein